MNTNHQDTILEKINSFFKEFAKFLFKKVFFLSKASKLERFVKNKYVPFALSQRKSIFMSIARFATINRPINGMYMEFGSHEGNTMRMAWDTFNLMFDWEFVAFDSFEGLPEISEIDQQEIWRKGKLKTGVREFKRIVRKSGMDLNRLIVVKGFYSETLNESCIKSLSPKKAAVVYIDCDLLARP